MWWSSRNSSDADIRVAWQSLVASIAACFDGSHSVTEHRESVPIKSVRKSGGSNKSALEVSGSQNQWQDVENFLRSHAVVASTCDFERFLKWCHSQQQVALPASEDCAGVSGQEVC